MTRSSVVASPIARPLVRRGRPLAAAVLVALAAGCTTAPLSYINDRQVYYRAVLNRYPVVLTAVDGSSTAFRPVPIAPGQHTLTLDAVPVAGFTVPVQKFYPMTIAPCTRYYIAAQRTSPLIQDWDLVVEETWPVAGCDPAKELEKAKTAAISGTAMPGSSHVVASALAPVDGAR